MINYTIHLLYVLEISNKQFYVGHFFFFFGDFILIIFFILDRLEMEIRI